MLVALHPNPATSFPLASVFAAGQGTVTVGRVEHNVISAINLNSNATQTLPEKLINMVGAAPRAAGRVLLLCSAVLLLPLLLPIPTACLSPSTTSAAPSSLKVSRRHATVRTLPAAPAGCCPPGALLSTPYIIRLS